MDYKDQSLSIISGSSILMKEDWDKIVSLQNELNDTFLHSQMFRTRTEMEVSVLNDIHFPTPDSKYWQSMREQNVHYNELVSLSYEYRKNIVEIKKLERDVASETDELERELKEIEIERKNFIRVQQERVAKDRIREIVEWSEIKKGLEPKLKYGNKEVGNHQAVSYAKQFIRQAFGLSEFTGIAEKNNMMGKLITTLKVCKENGLWDQVIDGLTEQELKLVKEIGF